MIPKWLSDYLVTSMPCLGLLFECYQLLSHIDTKHQICLWEFIEHFYLVCWWSHIWFYIMRLGSEIWPLYAQQACTVFRTAGKASGECLCIFVKWNVEYDFNIIPISSIRSFIRVLKIYCVVSIFFPHVLYFGAVNQLILILSLFLLILYSGSDLVVASSISFRIVACESQLGGRGVNFWVHI